MRFVSFVTANVFGTHVQKLLASKVVANYMKQKVFLLFRSNFFKSTELSNYFKVLTWKRLLYYSCQWKKGGRAAEEKAVRLNLIDDAI